MHDELHADVSERAGQRDTVTLVQEVPRDGHQRGVTTHVSCKNPQRGKTSHAHNGHG